MSSKAVDVTTFFAGLISSIICFVLNGCLLPQNFKLDELFFNSIRSVKIQWITSESDQLTNEEDDIYGRLKESKIAKQTSDVV